MKRIVVFILLALVAALPAAAGRSVDETRPADPKGIVSVELIAGRVEITGWNRNEVRVRGTLGDDVEELEIDAESGEVSIEVELRNGRNLRDGAADLRIEVPFGSEIEVETISAPVTIRDVRGPVDVETISGSVDVDGEVREVELASVSGKLTFVGRAPLRRGEFETVSGPISVQAMLDSNSRLSAESVSGNVRVGLPAGVSAEFDISTFSGRIVNDFGPSPKRAGDFLPGQSLEFSTGSGGARVEIESFSGRVELIRN